MSKYPKEYEDWAKDFKDEVSDQSGGLCHSGFAINGKFRYVNYTACFAEISRPARYTKGNKDVVNAVLVHIRNPKKIQSYSKCKTTPPESYVKYYDWLFNQSPWSDAYITKDIDWVMENGCVLLDPNANCDIVYGGAIATRFPYECPYNFQVWARMEELGVNKSLAFLIMHSYRNKKGDYSTMVVELSPMHHVSIRAGCSGTFWKKFLAGKYDTKREPYVTNTRHNVNGLWGDPNDDGFMAKLRYVEADDKNLYIFFNPAKSRRDSVFPGDKGLLFLAKSYGEKYA